MTTEKSCLENVALTYFPPGGTQDYLLAISKKRQRAAKPTSNPESVLQPMQESSDEAWRYQIADAEAAEVIPDEDAA